MPQAKPGVPAETDPGPGTSTLDDDGPPTARTGAAALDLGDDGPSGADPTDGPTSGDTTVAQPAVVVVADGERDGAASDDDASDDDVARRFWGEDDEARRAPRRTTSRRRRRRGRRTERVIRNVSSWSVFKVAVPFFACMWAVALIAGVILWEVSDQTGLIGNAESFWAEATGNESVSWDGEVVFRSAAVASGVLALASVGFAVLFAVLFNLICDITGGIRVQMLELEPRPGRRERRPARRARRAGDVASEGGADEGPGG